jgi:drug/metabolite transporter (DMT)-like permease
MCYRGEVIKKPAAARWASFRRHTVGVGAVLAAAGLLLLAADAFFAAQVRREAPNAVYDFPCFVLGTVALGIPGFLLLGTALLFDPRKPWKYVGVLCLIVAAAVPAMFVWANFLKPLLR